METPERLRAWMEEALVRHGWSQRQMSMRAGLAPNMVSLILGGHLPNESSLRSLAKAANTDENYVLWLGGYLARNPMNGRCPEIESIAERLEELPDKKLRAVLPVILELIERVEEL